MEIVLDTQIIYHMSGISVNNQLAKNSKELESILKNNKCYVTSFSILELISSNKNNISKIKTLLSPMFKENSYIQKVVVGNKIKCDVIEISKKIYNAPVPMDLRREFKLIENEKIRIEAETIRLFLYILVTGTFLNIEKEETTERLSIYRDFLIEKKETILNEISLVLEEGYRAGDLETKIKEKFNILFKTLVKNCIILKYAYVSGEHLPQINIEERDKFITKQLESDTIYRKLSKGDSNPIYYFGKKDKKEKTINYINNYLEPILRHKINSDNNWKFIIYKINKLFLNDAKFKKNDIFDMLILSAALDRSMQILTVDTHNCKYLESINSKSYELIKRVFI